ncbi:PQQ-binding-like beta-propeller repeat protein [Haloferula chungangensis]|uniref:PQQ-binding-like beta-propeller repeat protein n=1 Tax=Haloferula chungangensis TaxID=1048331 RepID=A0ABW2LEN2_9BACT
MKPFTTFALLAALAATPQLHADATGWLNWRGPSQTGASAEKALPSDLQPGKELWTYEIQGAGTPVIADGLLYAFGFYGEKGEDTQEALLCLDAVTGEKKWEHRFSDYISDVVYNRYGIGAPIVDPETRNVYLQTSNGRCVAFTRDGKQLWEISLIEEYGRLTFPNGRTGSPAVFGDLVIFHCVTANWGLTGPAADRFYAFDKITGEPVWDSTPGIRPVDSSFALPVFAKLGGHDVFYAGGGDGNVYGVDARTGKPLWRFPVSAGGVNSQVILLGNDKLVAVHGAENLDASTTGRMVCIKIPTTYPDGKEPLVLGKDAEVWRSDDITAFTSSPVLAEGKLYTTIATGELLCNDPETGKTLWRKKLAPDQIHASPTYGDGKLYVPFFDGHFYVVEPGDTGAEVLSEVKLTENCLGAPAIWEGKVYLFTKSKIHCWGVKEGKYFTVKNTPKPEPGEITQLQIIPNEFALKPGDSETFKVFGLDQYGNRVKEVTPESWEAFIPPSAQVKAKVDASFKDSTLTAGPDAQLSAGAFKATFDGMSATTRGRVVAGPGYSEDFEDIELSMDSPEGEKVNFPPLPWLGARIKWYVLEKDGSKVLANRLDNVLFQRTMNFFGHVDESDYVLQADVCTDGNRRIMSSVGLVNQRYLIALVGNSQILEVSSNYERVSQSVKFKITPNTWYTLKTHVKPNGDGTGTVFAKVWPREDDEPEAWTIEVPVKHCHPNGAPAVFAFSPQAQKRVYVDNIKLESAK